MKNGFEKVSVLLAAANITSRDLHHFVMEVQRIGPSGLIEHIEEIKSLIVSTSLTGQDFYDAETKARPSPNLVGEKIERLLIAEAGLPKRQAIEDLVEAIKQRHPAINIPQDSRKGFSAWLAKVVELIPASELLYIATTIRNNYVHDTPSRWRLK